MESAHYFMLTGEAKKAVDVLEEQLPRVNGNAAFLRKLREAYRGYIKELRMANNNAAAQRYLERLCILEPNAANDATLRPPEVAAAPAAPKAGPLPGLTRFFPNFAANNPKKDVQTEAKPTAVRAKVESTPADDDPFAPANMLSSLGKGAPDDARARIEPRQREQARQLVSRAEEAFARDRFPEARVLFEQAYQADKDSVAASRDRWGYCMLYCVYDQLKQPRQDEPTLAALERQVRGAMALAPVLEGQGKLLLREIDQRHKTPAAGALDVSAQVPVQHLGRNKEGWEVADTPNFRVFHHLSHAEVDKVAAVAEKTRRDMYRKWFGTDTVTWGAKCELILHPTANDYFSMTGVAAASPGHSRIESDAAGQRVISRRMDLRCDIPNLLETVLPHETTHIVLAGMFGKHVPRWADEGIAVLTEPPAKVEQHRRNLYKGQQEGLLFGVEELMKLEQYPQAHRIAAFYAQSVCLVEFMCELHGPVVFTTFVRDGLHQGYDSALRKHYGMTMGDLQQRWQERLGQGNHVAARP
jgi:hypothetical protein